MSAVTLYKGQMIHWPRAVGGYAQVDDLRRKKVRLVYRTKRGTLRFAIVAAVELAHRQTFMPGVTNVLDRGLLPAAKTYEFPPPLWRAGHDATSISR